MGKGSVSRTITKAAAVASLRGDSIVKATLANTAPLLRRQCAAVVWLCSDVCTADNLGKLALADHSYLLTLCCLLGGGTSKAQSRRTLAHLKLHPGDSMRLLTFWHQSFLHDLEILLFNAL
jgi:hypothetical protein